MTNIVEAYFRLLKVTLVLCLGGMVVLVFGNVLLRYAFNSGITASEEVARLFFLYTTFLGAIVAMREHLHLGVDSIVRRLPAAGRKACLVVSHVLMLFACGLFLQGSWAQTAINLNVKMPVTGVSMGLFYGTGVVFSISVGLILVHDLYLALSGKLTGDELVMVRESEDEAALQAHAAPSSGLPAAAR